MLVSTMPSLIHRQSELFHEVLERERALQTRVVNRAFGPFDAVFDLLEESSAASRSQAEAIEDAARALERVANLMKVQADLFERTVRTLRQPGETVKTLAGGQPSRDSARAPRRGRGRSRG
jgi:hypothetical protein